MEIRSLLDLAYTHGREGKFPDGPASAVELFTYLKMLSTPKFDPKLAALLSGGSINSEEEMLFAIMVLVDSLKWRFEQRDKLVEWEHSRRCADNCGRILAMLPDWGD